MQGLSVVIITFNEEKNIARCIDSVKSIADEIIVLDSYSTDDTARIAEEKNAKVYTHHFAGYVEQKNKALSLCSHNYVLSLDADEELDEKLIQSILAVKKNFTARAYTMNRCTNYCGQFIRHGAWYPDKKLRLFDRRIASWSGIDPHDKVILKEGITTKHLAGDILHYSYHSVKAHILQNERFSSIAAHSFYKAGKRTKVLRLFINPAWAFFYGYFIRMGFLEGRNGFTIARLHAQYTYLKHAKLFRLQKKWSTYLSPIPNDNCAILEDNKPLLKKAL
jgi:glycosyltransferase involved in cell wall biosynthesis